ncbi:MAG: RNA 3'-terminal phosphate cyclase [Gammaproteobacteria bacterium]
MKAKEGYQMESLEIDGSQGEGGGQVLRTALSLSACTGRAVQLRHIRSGRKKPGLMRQHLACVNAAAEICGAKVKGASLGSKNIQFVPGEIKAGDYRFSVGSAGSSTLIFQTVLPLLMQAGNASQLTLEGGTHNPLAPSFDFINEVFLPVLRRIGVECRARIDRYGFYPVGGGQWRVAIEPSVEFKRIDLTERGELVWAEAVCLDSGLPSHVTQREMKRLQDELSWSAEWIKCRHVKALGSGNVVSLRVHYRHASEVIDSIGIIGVSAERVANKAVEQLRHYQNFGAPVGEHLADQLLLPLALASGGTFVTGPLSAHVRTNIEVIKQFLDVDIHCEEIAPKRQWRISVQK